MELDDLNSMPCPAKGSIMALGRPAGHSGLSLDGELKASFRFVSCDHKNEVKFSLSTTLQYSEMVLCFRLPYKIHILTQPPSHPTKVKELRILFAVCKEVWPSGCKGTWFSVQLLHRLSCDFSLSLSFPVLSFLLCNTGELNQVISNMYSFSMSKEGKKIWFTRTNLFIGIDSSINICWLPTLYLGLRNDQDG